MNITRRESLPSMVVQCLDRRQSAIPMGRDKRPLFKWQRYQTSLATYDDLLRWQVKFSGQIRGWARITGQLSGVIVLDDDQGGWMERLGLYPHVRTGSGGFHWIGRHPG